jgi:hypothetical protein
MKFIKKINEFFGQEEEIERDDIFTGDEEEGDFYFDEEEGHDEEEGDFSHEEENWGDEESSSLGSSRISSFDDFGGEESDDEEYFSQEEFNSPLHNREFSDEDGNESDDEDCHTCEHDDEENLDSPETDETSFVESFKAFNEKKKMNAGLQAYLDKKAGKKSKEDDKEDDKKSKKDDKEDDKKEEKGGKGLTAAQKKLPEALRKAIEKKSKK